MTNTPELTIERLFASPKLAGPAPQNVKFSPDGQRLVTAGADKLARIWDALYWLVSPDQLNRQVEKRRQEWENLLRRNDDW